MEMNSKEQLVENLVKDFGDTVRAYRISNGMTLQDMAEVVSLSPSYVFRIEKRKRNPDLDVRIRFIMDAMGFSSVDLLLYLEKYIVHEKQQEEIDSEDKELM